MRVELSYIDSTSVAPEDIKAQAKALYGDSVKVEVSADSDDVYNLLYFAFQEFITIKQVNSFFDDGILYPARVAQLKKEAIGIVERALSQVIEDNEGKLT